MYGKNKYNAVRVRHPSGRVFPSKLEAAVYDVLLLRQRCGEIKDIKFQDPVCLTLARIRLVVDFKFFNIKLNRECWCEAKGKSLPVFNIKKRLWKFYGEGPLEIYNGSYENPSLSEIVIPETPQHKSPQAP